MHHHIFQLLKDNPNWSLRHSPKMGKYVIERMSINKKRARVATGTNAHELFNSVVEWTDKILKDNEQ